MDDNSRMKYLIEYQLRGNTNGFPTYNEYREKYIKELENEEKPQAVGEPAPDGQESIPEPEIENNPEPSQEQPPVDNNVGQEVPPAPAQPPVEPPVETTPAPAPSVDNTQNLPVEDNSDDILRTLEDRISSQEGTLSKILKILEPEPEPSPEEKIISKLDSLSKEVEELKNGDALKKEKIKNMSPFSTSLSQMWNDAEEKEDEEFKISQADVNNYDPNYIKKTLGIPSGGLNGLMQ